MSAQETQWDVFISYASEDRDGVAQLAELLLEQGVRVWFDKFELGVGDSLRERVDEGLAQSRFGVVILSPNFLNKHYPTRELNGLAQREIDGKKVILPIWKEISAQEIRAFSPPLADRIALQWTDGIVSIAADLLTKIRPDLAAKARGKAAEYIRLSELTSGGQLMNLLQSTDSIIHVHEELTTEAEINDVTGFLQQIEDTLESLEFLDIEQRARRGLQFNDYIKELKSINWKIVFGHRARKMNFDDGKSIRVNVLMIAVVNFDCDYVVVRKNEFLIHRPNRTSTSRFNTSG